MKRKVIATIGILSTVLLIATSVIRSNRGDEVFNKNVEALSRGDIYEGEAGSGDCWNSVHVVDNQLILVCGSCIYIRATENFLSSKGTC